MASNPMMAKRPMTKQAMMVGTGMDEAESMETEKPEEVDCPNCDGTGVDIDSSGDKVRTIKCAQCGGTGKVPADQTEDEMSGADASMDKTGMGEE